ncbi:MAG: TetR/AcrR family transcriptional regulator [Acetobacteraceae bacterium]|jgi:AcrR family transcriptional regulator|nr:TetR/AcrR family transcriptional regulator [Acetobacteraceae bacterium]
MSAGAGTLERAAEAASRPGRQRMSDSERVHTLCEAAEAVFLRDGYAAAHMDDVARGAGMSKRTLYQVFPSKAALFEATVSAALGPLALVPARPQEDDLEAALVAMIEAVGRHLLAPRQMALFRLVIAEVHRSPELAEAFHRVTVARGASSLQRLISAEIRRGRLRLTDAKAAARMLYGAALGPAQLMTLLGLREPPDEREISQLAREAVAVFLRGAQVR